MRCCAWIHSRGTTSAGGVDPDCLRSIGGRGQVEDSIRRGPAHPDSSRISPLARDDERGWGGSWLPAFDWRARAGQGLNLGWILAACVRLEGAGRSRIQFGEGPLIPIPHESHHSRGMASAGGGFLLRRLSRTGKAMHGHGSAAAGSWSSKLMQLRVAQRSDPESQCEGNREHFLRQTLGTAPKLFFVSPAASTLLFALISAHREGPGPAAGRMRSFYRYKNSSSKCAIHASTAKAFASIYIRSNYLPNDQTHYGQVFVTVRSGGTNDASLSLQPVDKDVPTTSCTISHVDKVATTIDQESNSWEGVVERASIGLFRLHLVFALPSSLDAFLFAVRFASHSATFPLLSRLLHGIPTRQTIMAAFRPMDTLPVELLAEISIHYRQLLSRSDVDQVLLLGSVCSRWRDVAWLWKALWSKTHFRLGPSYFRQDFWENVLVQYLTLETSVYDEAERTEENPKKPASGNRNICREGTGPEQAKRPPGPHKQHTASKRLKSQQFLEHALVERCNGDRPKKAASIAVPRSSLPKSSLPQAQFIKKHSHNMSSNGNNGNNTPFNGFYMDSELYADRDLYPVFTAPPNANPTPAANPPSATANAALNANGSMAANANANAASNPNAMSTSTNSSAASNANAVASTSANSSAAFTANAIGAPAPNANVIAPANANPNAAVNGFYMDGEDYNSYPSITFANYSLFAMHLLRHAFTMLSYSRLTTYAQLPTTYTKMSCRAQEARRAWAPVPPRCDCTTHTSSSRVGKAGRARGGAGRLVRTARPKATSIRHTPTAAMTGVVAVVVDGDERKRKRRHCRCAPWCTSDNATEPRFHSSSIRARGRRRCRKGRKWPVPRPNGSGMGVGGAIARLGLAPDVDDDERRERCCRRGVVAKPARARAGGKRPLRGCARAKRRRAAIVRSSAPLTPTTANSTDVGECNNARSPPGHNTTVAAGYEVWTGGRSRRQFLELLR
ncbi:hypothetical protein C8R43DRAFT_1203252 [Mycena crocata]|nr:hypothetical protein C8R43DRAFT_1203252 [Mycena crocata]